jgi:nitroreductase
MQGILSVLQERTSARGLFDPSRPVDGEQLRQVLEAARWAPSAHNMQNFEFVVVTDPRVIEEIGSLRYPVSSTFIQENYRQLSFSEEELARKKVGILAANFPPDWRTPPAGRGEVEEQENAFVGSALKSSPVLVFMLYDPSRRAPASEGDFLGIVSLGCVLENMWVTAASLGLGFHVVSSVGTERVEPEIKRILSVPAPLKVVFACRLGYPASPAPRPQRVRRDVEDFTSYGYYGTKRSAR